MERGEEEAAQGQVTSQHPPPPVTTVFLSQRRPPSSGSAHPSPAWVQGRRAATTISDQAVSHGGLGPAEVRTKVVSPSCQPSSRRAFRGTPSSMEGFPNCQASWGGGSTPEWHLCSGGPLALQSGPSHPGACSFIHSHSPHNEAAMGQGGVMT